MSPPIGRHGEAATLDYLVGLGVPCVRRKLAASAEQAALAAGTVGFPVVIKAAVAEAVHKSDLGLVKIGIGSRAEARSAFAGVAAAAARHGLSFDGVIVEEQVAGIELFAGIVRDPVLGPAVAFGSGGIAVEVMDDVALEMAPLSREQALALIRGTRAWRLMSGFRGATPIDPAPIANLLMTLGDVACAAPGIVELDLNPVIAAPGRVTAVDARMVVEPPPAVPQRPLPRQPLPDALFHPRGVIVIGASQDPGKAGGRVVDFLARHRFPGPVYKVNPRAEGRGDGWVRSIQDVPPGSADLACIALPAAAVPRALWDCVAAAVPAAIVLSAGFAEAGTQGRALQEDIVRIIREASGKLRVSGPNCNGIVGVHDRVTTSFGGALDRADLPSGGVAFLTQSGAMGSALLSRCWDTGYGFSRWISTGNEADLDVADYLRYLADDPRTSVILVFLESLRDPLGFAGAVDACHRAGKPVVVYKAGGSAAGRASVASHTGAVAGADRVYSAFLRRCGVVRARSLQQLLDAGRLLDAGSPHDPGPPHDTAHPQNTARPHDTARPTPSGRRAAIVTLSGGAASVLADECERARITIDPFPPELQNDLAEILPAYGSVRNPVDATTQAAADPAMFAAALARIVNSGVADFVLVQLTTNADPGATGIAHAIVEARESIPLFVARAGAESLAPEAMRVYREAGVPIFDLPERLVAVVAVVLEYVELGGRRNGRLSSRRETAAPAEGEAQPEVAAVAIDVPDQRDLRSSTSRTTGRRVS